MLAVLSVADSRRKKGRCRRLTIFLLLVVSRRDTRPARVRAVAASSASRSGIVMDVQSTDLDLV